ncbi:MAG: hypothetical protein ACK4WB_00020 [Desulfatiglandales bacterium]
MEFEREYIAKSIPSFSENLRIFEALYREAVSLGVLPLKNSLEGIEVDIRIAKILNSLKR